MSEPREDDPLQLSRDATLRCLGEAHSLLRGGAISIDVLFLDMQSPLHRAVEYWLRRRDEPQFGIWADREAHFLRLAPADLQDEYLRIAGALPHLANALFEQLGSTSLRDIIIDSPSLAPWIAQARDWLQDASRLVEALLHANEAKPRIRAERGELFGGYRSLFRPGPDWTASTRPAGDAPSATLSVRLKQPKWDYGWIDLHLKLDARATVVTCSDVYDPLPVILDWLWAIRDGDLPAGVVVDEESSDVCLIAQAFDEKRLLIAVLDRHDKKERAAAVVDHSAFLSAFRQEIIRFLHVDFAMDRWNPSDGNEEGNPDVYLDRLLQHPFIA